MAQPSTSAPDFWTAIASFTSIITSFTENEMITTTLSFADDITASKVTDDDEMTMSPYFENLTFSVYTDVIAASHTDDSSTTPCAEPVPYTVSPFADDHLVNGFYVGMMFFMATSGIIGNTLIIGAVFVHKKLMVLSNALIVNLAVTDFMVCAFVNVFTIVGVFTKGLFFHNKHAFCEFLGVICITSCCCSLWTIAAIALNRYIIICHRVYYTIVFNKNTMPWFIIGLWVLCFLVDLPNLLGWGGHAFDKKALFCTYDFMADYTYSIFFAIWLFALPLLILSYAYARIVMYSRATKKALRRVQKMNAVRNCNGIRVTDLRLLRSVLTLWIAMSVLWTPYACVLLFDRDFSWPREFYIFALAFAHLSSSTNSIIYGVTNKNFRDGYVILLQTLTCRRMKRSPSIAESLQSVSRNVNEQCSESNRQPKDCIGENDIQCGVKIEPGTPEPCKSDDSICMKKVDSENGEMIWLKCSRETLESVL